MRGDEYLSLPLAKALLKLISQDAWPSAIERTKLIDLLEPYLPYKFSVNQMSRVLHRIMPEGYPQMGRTGRLAGNRTYLYVFPDKELFIKKCDEWVISYL